MKRWIKNFIGIVLFILLMWAVFSALRPVYKFINGVVAEYEAEVSDMLRKKTGLGISYRKLSPSLLTGIHINGITVFDEETGEEMLTIRNAVISYSLKSVLKGDFDNAFSKLLINDVTIEFDRDKYSRILEKIQLLMGTNEKKDEGKNNVKISPEGASELRLLGTETLEKIHKVLTALPFAIQFKNINVHYRQSGIDLLAGIKSLALSRENSVSISANLNGYAFATLDALKKQTVGTRFSVKGNFMPEISGSSAIVALDQYSKADYSLKSTEFLLRYNEGSAMLKTTQRSSPYAISAECNLSSGDVALDLSTKNLDPFSLVKMPPLKGALSYAKGVRISTDASANLNILNGAYDWKAKGSLSLPRKITPEGETVSFNLSGDKNLLRIGYINAYGPMVGAKVTGTFNIPKKIPSGEVVLEHFKLPNGGLVSGEMYVDPIDDGFTCFMPQLYLGEQALTALQVDVFPTPGSLDFSLKVNDYSHQEEEAPGEIRVDGSVVLKTKDIQAHVAVDRFYIDTIAKAGSFFLPEETQGKVTALLPKLEPFITSCELFVSTDLKNITYNSPYVVVANTQKDRQMLLLSFDGNQESVQVTQLDLVYGNQSVQATVNADISAEDRQVLFSTICNVNHIPYEFTGVYTMGEWLNISGDYNLEVFVNLNDPLNGALQFSDFPVAVGSMLLAFSTQTSFSYSALEGIHVNIENFQIEEIGGKIGLAPKISVAGTIDNDSLELTDIIYIDTASELEGEGGAEWIFTEEGVFDSLNFGFQVASQMSQEHIDVTGNVSNPLQSPLSVQNAKSDFFFSVEALIEDFPMGSLFKNQHDDDTLTARISANGTVDNPYVNLVLDSLSMQVKGAPVHAKGEASIIEENINISHIEADWRYFRLDNIMGTFDLSSFDGLVQSDFSAKIGSAEPFTAPMVFTVTSNKTPPEEKAGFTSLLGLPSEITLYIDADPLSGGILKKDIPLHFVAQHSPGVTVITSDEYLGISGMVKDSGEMAFTVDKSKPFHFDMNGSIVKSMMDLHFQNLQIDLPSFDYIINSDLLSIYKGQVKGFMDISGLLRDPVFEGFLAFENLDFNSPDFISEHLTARRVELSMVQDEFDIPVTDFSIGNNVLSVGAHARMGRWEPEEITATLSTNSGDIPIDVDVPLMDLKGQLGLEAELKYTEDSVVLSGEATLNNATVSILDSITELDFSSLTGKTKTDTSRLGINVDMDFLIGQKVMIVVNPIMRTLLAPATPVHLSMDTANSLWAITGDIVLKGGEVFYLSRNFYLKEGRLVLNETQNSFDPVLTVRAETRERDSNGDSVTISLQALQQPLSKFSPSLSSSPAKSESEIYALIGQIASGDSSSFSDVLVTTGDWVAQTLFVRKLENALRDLCNFDIFSIRTTVLQNILTQGLNGNSSAKAQSIGNYFDNSTVYIGKYFGDDVYADAQLQWTYDENSVVEGDGPLSGLVFKPEIGFELTAPFANIRWQFAPDMGSLQKSWVPATSISLSWRINF